MNILFIGDIFGKPGIDYLVQNLKQIIIKNKIDFVVAQAENVSGRKGFIPEDYQVLKNCGINAFTLGNHVWAKNEVMAIIENHDVIRPWNIKSHYPGQGTSVFNVKGKKIRVTQFMGRDFNELNKPWKEKKAENFFDFFDKLTFEEKVDYHIIDFHGETTSEKNVFALYVDGKVSAVLGTHTHVQTNDARILPKGTAYITDVGMTGPINSAIGAQWNSVYQKMRYDKRSVFLVSKNKVELNAVILNLNHQKNEIKTIKQF